ncbi:hypothetical protein ABPG74_006766 [Tetrahymena malaccensis]
MRTLFKFVAVAALISTLLLVSFSDKINLRSTYSNYPDCVYLQRNYGEYYVRNACTQSMQFKILLKSNDTGLTSSVTTKCMHDKEASFFISQYKYQIIEITQNTC